MRSQPVRPLAFCVAAALAASSLCAQATARVTTPKEALGFNIGDDYQMASYTQLAAWWKKLATESDRMKLGDHRPDGRGAAAVHGHHHLPGQRQEARPV